MIEKIFPYFLAGQAAFLSHALLHSLAQALSHDCAQAHLSPHFLAHSAPQAHWVAHLSPHFSLQQAVAVESQQAVLIESQQAVATAHVSAFDTAVESHEFEEQQPLLPHDTIAAPATAIIKRKNFFIFWGYLLGYPPQR